MDFFYGERERVLFASAAKGYLVSSIKDKLAEAQFEVAVADTLESVDEELRIDFCEEFLDDKDVLLICTDGLTNYVTESEICEITSDFNYYN